MYWQKRFDRVDPDKELEEHILSIRKEHKDFGYRRVLALLKKDGILINKKKVQRIMQKLGLQVTSYTRKSRRYNSYKGKVGRIAPNRINRRFNTSIAHQKITTDTSEFKYYEIDSKGRMVIKKLYLDPFLDMFNGEIISYSISKTPSAVSVLSAQKKAIEVTSDCLYRRIFHSDRGWAYQMHAYTNELKENRIFQSVSTYRLAIQWWPGPPGLAAMTTRIGMSLAPRRLERIKSSRSGCAYCPASSISSRVKLRPWYLA